MSWPKPLNQWEREDLDRSMNTALEQADYLETLKVIQWVTKWRWVARRYFRQLIGRKDEEGNRGIAEFISGPE